MTALLVLDVGNTNVKAALLDAGAVTGRCSVDHRGDLEPLRAFVGEIDESVPAAMIRVDDDAAASVREALSGRRIYQAPEDFLPLIENRCDPPQSVGQDRLFAACGVQEAPAVVVDAGTAITVDRIGDDGAFEGGAIAPGLRLALLSLHRNTGKLPDLTRELVDETVRAPTRGTDTRGAMLCGTVRGLAGLVDRLIDDVGGGCTRVFLTGGDAPRLRPYLAHEVTVDPDLVARGVARSFAAREDG